MPYTLMGTLLLHRLGARTTSGLAPAPLDGGEHGDAGSRAVVALADAGALLSDGYPRGAVVAPLLAAALVVLVALGHSLTNYVFLRAAAVSLRWAKALAAVAGCGALTAGLAFSR